MIPISLHLSGFLSYLDPTDLDFTRFDLACISGANGAGKSSLLDALTWVLFGQARRRDDALINSHARAAEVILDFSYEGNVYRVQRTKPRDKSVILEFQIQDPEGGWRSLTEKTTRDTELRIQQALRLDYETFINASFFLQGKADQFAQQRPGDRKRILSSILGLEVWEMYREGAATRRKACEADLAVLDSRLVEIDNELAEETPRREHLKQLEDSLGKQEKLRRAAETSLDGIRRLQASLAEQKHLVEVLAAQLQTARQRLEQHGEQITARQQERAAFQAQLDREAEIRADYAAWQEARSQLESWEQVAAQFRQVESRRASPLMAIEKERAALEQEHRQLMERQRQAQVLQDQKLELEKEAQAVRDGEAKLRLDYEAWLVARRELERLEKLAVEYRRLENQRTAPQMVIEKQQAALQQERIALLASQKQAGEMERQRSDIQKDLRDAHSAIEALQARLEVRPQREEELANLQEKRTTTRAENERLMKDMTDLKDRIARLEEAEGATCPVCGQPLSEAERQQLVASLGAESQNAEQLSRSNQDFLKSSEAPLKELWNEIESLRSLEKNQLQAQNRRAAGLEERQSRAEMELESWRTGGALRLAEVERILAGEDFAQPERQKLEQNDAQVKALGYNPEAHEKIRQAEKEGRSSEEQLQVYGRQLASLEERLKKAAADLEDWRTGGEPRLAEVARILAGEDFAAAARLELAAVDGELKTVGYDAAAHDAARQVEQGGRTSQEALRQLENARAALGPLEREITSLESQFRQEEQEAGAQDVSYQAAEAKFQADSANLPDIDQAEAELYDLREQEDELRRQVGAASQQVEVLKKQKANRKELNRRREAIKAQIGRYKQLERAFSKDGVPALLIEQALPEIETQANEILDRLTAGNMSVRFETQREYKDKSRDDKRETLDILISDSAGTREYELFSGGEAFRINFAIRLALSHVLAQRAGARLQTLVIDEGFGSQDSEGRQRLVEAINLVKPDFAKVLVITHLEELKDAFPARIEVEKTVRGSQVHLS